MRGTVLFAVAASLGLGGFSGFGRPHWEFYIVNKSNVPAVEFRTQDNGEWSSNWIKDRIEPGDKFNMDFGTDKGDCTIRTQIRFLDGTYFDADVDYCKASTLYMYDNKLTWE